MKQKTKSIVTALLLGGLMRGNTVRRHYGAGLGRPPARIC